MENTGMNKPRGRPFEVGNTAGRGRPKGSRNQATLAKSELFGEYAEAITQKLVSMALEGDPLAMRLCMERIHPPLRAMPVTFKLPRVKKVSDLPAALNSILRAVASSKISPAEAQQMVSLLNLIAAVLSTQVPGSPQSLLMLPTKELPPTADESMTQ